MMLGIFCDLMPAYIFFGILLFTRLMNESKDDNIDIPILRGTGGYLITLATNPCLIVENTLMVITNNTIVVFLSVMAKLGKI
jgi:hypothetical protein